MTPDLPTQAKALAIVDKFKMDTKDSDYTVIEGDDADQLVLDIAHALAEARREGLEWTADKPTQPGWYWWRCNERMDTHPQCVVEVIRFELEDEPKYWFVRGAGINWSLGNTPGQWSSAPLEPPQEPAPGKERG